MYQAIAKIHEELDRREIRHIVNEDGQLNIIALFFSTEVAQYKISYLKGNNIGNHLHCTFDQILEVPEEKQEKVLRLLNQLNNDYMYLRFYLSNGFVHARYTFLPAFSPIEDGAYELLRRGISIMDDCYPQLVQAIQA